MKNYKAVPELQTLSASTDGWFYDGEKEFSGNIENHGYVVVSHKGKQYRAHRIVAQTYLDETLPLRKTDDREVDHFGSRNDNNVENLRIVNSHQQNCNLPWSKERYSKHNSRIGKRWSAIQAVKDGKVIKEFGPDDTVADIAEWLGKTPEQTRANINAYFEGKTHHAYSYQWVRVPKVLSEKQRKWKQYLHDYHIRRKQEKMTLSDTIDKLAEQK